MRVIDLREPKERTLNFPLHWYLLLDPVPCDGKKTINIACLPRVTGGIDIALDGGALQSLIIQSTINGQNITHIQRVPEPRKMVFEHPHDFGTSCLPTRDLDSIGCTGSDVNHLFKLGVFECLDGLEKLSVMMLNRGK
jgi:hypothetical protein